jgi:hypothetical protein
VAFEGRNQGDSLESQTEVPGAPDEDDDAPKSKRKTRRDQELSGRLAISERLTDIFADVEKGFQDQRDRQNTIMDHWDAYNCKLTEAQGYNGNSRICVPFIADAIDARKTRFVNQMFPQSGRSVECISSDETQPDAIVALMEDYILKCRLRTEVAPALSVSGDLEGQYNLYVDWSQTERHTVRRVQKAIEVDGVELPGEEPFDSMEEEVLVDAGPDIEVLNDSDVLILPTTTNSVRKAIDAGGSVTVKRRWSKTQIREMMDRGEIIRSAGETLLETMSKPEGAGHSDIAKKQAEAAGVKAGGGGGKYCIGYETWTKLKVDAERRLCVARWAGEVLGCKLCPYWSDLEPVISVPVKKVAGLAKGRAPVISSIDMQVFANDMTNAGADTAYFSAMPIIAADPQASPGPLILGLAAIWKIAPDAVKFMQFPELWRGSQEIVANIKQQIFQSLGVNPAMIPQSTGGKQKRNQAEIAQEQQVDMLTTADAVSVLEDVFNQMLERILWYDHQFRDEETTVRQYGEMGLRAQMQAIEPIQMGTRYTLRWLGVETARNAAMIQQQIAFLNVLKGIPPQMMQGYKINLAPAIVNAAYAMFGYRVAPLIVQDMRYQQSVDPELENKLLAEGFDLMVHPGDDDPKHMEAHLQAKQADGDVHATFASHMQKHQMQMQAKAMAAQQQMQQQGGQPGGGQGPQGPQGGSQPQPPRPMRGPGGMIHPDQLSAAGAPQAPRKT